MGLSQPFIDGFSVSAILLIAALGLAIIFGYMKVINMAHGELIMIGAYTTYVMSTVVELPFFVAVITAFIVSALVGILMEVTVIRKLYGRPLETILATFGLSIVLQQVIKIFFGTGAKSVANPIPGSFELGSVIIPYFRLFIFLISIALILLTAFLLMKTTLGTKVRTVSQNRQMSECLGINTAKVDMYTFAYGSGLAGVAGAILAPIKTISPTMGFDYLIDSFMVVVIGGIGSILGTTVGSFVIGESQQLLSFIGTETMAKILVFLLIILVIRFRPEGLFRKGGRS